MKIMVDTGRGKPITYEADFEVEVGDMVLLPALPWQNPSSTNDAEVVALESDYDGPCKHVLSKLPAHEEQEDCGCVLVRRLGEWSVKSRCVEHGETGSPISL